MNAISLYGKMLAFSRLKIHDNNLDAIISALADFDTTKTVPVVIESTEALPLATLIDKLWEKNIAVIGVVDGALNEEAQTLKLAVFPSDGKRIARLDEKPKDTTPPTPQESDGVAVVGVQAQKAELAPTSPAKTETQTEDTKDTSPHNSAQSIGVNSFVHTQMVRSGQVLHHMGGDLIITAPVNNGSEVATDYNLHIYGKAQGRLVAGATGDENARIFCQQFDPSLVSVAGTYCLKDDIPAEMINQAVQVSFSEGKLIFKRMNG